MISRLDVVKLSSGALSRAICWTTGIFKNAETRNKHHCNEVGGYCFIMKSLMNVVCEGYDCFSPILMECQKRQPVLSIDAYLKKVDNFKFDYLEDYLDLLQTQPPILPYTEEYDQLLGSCKGCKTCPECLYLFKETLSVIDARFHQKGTNLAKIINRNIRSIEEVLNATLIKEKDKCGWPHSLYERVRVDPYVTARILVWLREWKDHINTLKLKEDLHPDSSLFKQCIETIKNLQISSPKKVLKSYYYGGRKADIRGSWEEIEFGKFPIYRVKATSDIAMTLYRLDGNSDIIKEARSFIDRSFAIDKPDHCTIDSTTYMDLYYAMISDIIGTAAAVRFYIATQNSHKIGVNHPYVLDKLMWLIRQQRPEGSWPIISDDLFKRSKIDKWLRSPSMKAEKIRHEKNISVPHTTIMIDVLRLFLENIV